MFAAILIMVFMDGSVATINGPVIFPSLESCQLANKQQEEKVLQISSDKKLAFKYEFQCVEIDQKFKTADGLTHA